MGRALITEAVLVAPAPVRWRSLSLAETGASVCVSACCYRGSENVGVMPVVVAELKFRDVQRQIFFADFVERTDDPAFEDRPEAFNGLRVDRADNVFAMR